jgi:hypothetical protein
VSSDLACNVTDHFRPLSTVDPPAPLTDGEPMAAGRIEATLPERHGVLDLRGALSSQVAG